jgi:hypothetical protein
MIEICRDRTANVKRWRDGRHGAPLVRRGDGRSQFRRVNGYLRLPALRRALDADAARTVTPLNYAANVA